MTNRRHFGNVRKLPSGRYQASYWQGGERHLADTTFSTKADAQACLSTMETDILRGGWINPKSSRVTLDALAIEWLTVNPQKRSSTFARDNSILRVHVLPTLGKRPLATVTRRDIQSLVDKWASVNAPSTVSRQYATLRAMFSYAEDTERLVRNPCRRIRLPRSRLVERPVLKSQELEFLAEVLGPDQAIFMWMGAILGLRWAEVAGLTVNRLNLLEGKVTVDRQMTRSGQLDVPKSTAGVRTFACPKWLIEEMAQHLAWRGLSAKDGDQLVFVSPDGGPLVYSNWRRRIWQPSCESAKLAGLRFHDLRSDTPWAFVIQDDP